MLHLHGVGLQVVVGELCGMAVLRGADVFAPGLMGAPWGEYNLIILPPSFEQRTNKGIAV